MIIEAQNPDKNKVYIMALDAQNRPIAAIKFNDIKNEITFSNWRYEDGCRQQVNVQLNTQTVTVRFDPLIDTPSDLVTLPSDRPKTAQLKTLSRKPTSFWQKITVGAPAPNGSDELASALAEFTQAHNSADNETFCMSSQQANIVHQFFTDNQPLMALVPMLSQQSLGAKKQLL